MRILWKSNYFDDVISGWKYPWIKTSFGVTQDTGLNFHMKQSEWDFRPLVAQSISSIEAMFSILRLKKIDQNGLESDIQKLFYTNLSTQNPMSWLVFFFIKRRWNFRKTKVESHQYVSIRILRVSYNHMIIVAQNIKKIATVSFSKLHE